MIDDYDKFCGSKLKELRVLNNLTMEEVGEKVGKVRSVISYYESGKTKVDVTMLAKLLSIYNYPIGRFIEECLEKCDK